jgi:hypothetical protein
LGLNEVVLRQYQSDRPAPGRRLGDTDSESEGPSSEEGEVRRKSGRRRGYDDDDDEAYMGDEGTYGKSRSRARDDKVTEEKVELPVTPEDLNGVRLSRWELVDMKHRSFFRDMVVGESSCMRAARLRKLLTIRQTSRCLRQVLGGSRRKSAAEVPRVRGRR